MIKKILAAAIVGTAALGAHASANLVANGGFDGTTGDYVYNDTPQSIADAGVGVPVAAGTVAGWSGSFTSIAAGSGPWGTPSSLAGFDAGFGGYVAGLQDDATLSQQLTLAAGTYTLTWSDANRAGYGGNQNYAVFFDGQQLNATAIPTTGGAGWHTETLTFTTAGGTGDLSFVGGTSFATVDATSFIDNVTLAAVPEPTALLLMAAGMLPLLAWRRRSSI